VDDLHKECSSRLKAIQMNVTSTSDIKRAAEFVEKDLNGKGWMSEICAFFLSKRPFRNDNENVKLFLKSNENTCSNLLVCLSCKTSIRSVSSAGIKFLPLWNKGDCIVSNMLSVETN